MNEDLAAVLEAMRANRGQLVAGIQPLTSEDMQRARRGGWSVGRVLHHVIESEVAYVRLIAHLRGQPARELTATEPVDGAAAVEQLRLTREALVQAADGVDDDTLYAMSKLGANEYSVLSVLENDADHDHEHLSQIERLLSGVPPPAP